MARVIAVLSAFVFWLSLGQSIHAQGPMMMIGEWDVESIQSDGLTREGTHEFVIIQNETLTLVGFADTPTVYRLRYVATEQGEILFDLEWERQRIRLSHACIATLSDDQLTISLAAFYAERPKGFQAEVDEPVTLLQLVRRN